MARITRSDLVVPCLLDRLTNRRLGQSEGNIERFVTIDELRKQFRRDLAWLLNTGSLDQTEDLSRFPNVAKSVLNYGWRDLTGKNISENDVPAIQRSLRESILAFEPRLRPETLKVRVATLTDEGESLFRSMKLGFEIEGELVWKPIAFHIFLKAGIDLNTGDVVVREE